MSALHDDHRSPEQAEREVEEARARLQSTLGEIRSQLSPGQMLDHALDYARESGGAETARNFGRQVRDNPMPLALVAAGIAWMMTGDRFAPRSHSARHADDLARRMGRASDHLDDGHSRTDDLRHRADAVRDGVSDGIHRAGDTVSGYASSMRDGMSGYAASVRDGAGHMRGAVSDYAHAAGDGIDRLQRRTGELMHEQPLLMGAVGLAAGAILAAVLPSTRTEGRLFGETNDRLWRETGSALKDGLDRAAHEGANLVRETADRVNRPEDEQQGAVGSADTSGTAGSAQKGAGMPDPTSKPVTPGPTSPAPRTAPPVGSSAPTGPATPTTPSPLSGGTAKSGSAPASPVTERRPAGSLRPGE